MESLTLNMYLLNKPAFQKLSYTGKTLAPKVMVQVGFPLLDTRAAERGWEKNCPRPSRSLITSNASRSGGLIK